MGEDRGRDLPVVREQVALRGPLLRPEDLVEVGELQRPLALPDLGGERLLAANVLGQLVLAYSQERWGTQVAVMRPLRELDLDDELRFDPSHIALPHARHLRHLHERRVGSLERLHAGEQLVDRVLRETRADVAGPAQAAPLLHGNHERAHALPPPLSLRVARDHELLPRAHLHLQPVTRASLLVEGLLSLGHDPLEALLGRRVEQRVSVVERVREGQPTSSGREASSGGCGARSAADRRAALRPARARRRRNRRASRSPAASPRSSRVPCRPRRRSHRQGHSRACRRPAAVP